jgi:hypothetical protein
MLRDKMLKILLQHNRHSTDLPFLQNHVRLTRHTGNHLKVLGISADDPNETLAALAPEDKADPRVDEVYLSGERQRPV